MMAANMTGISTIAYMAVPGWNPRSLLGASCSVPIASPALSRKKSRTWTPAGNRLSAERPPSVQYTLLASGQAHLTLTSSPRLLRRKDRGRRNHRLPVLTESKRNWRAMYHAAYGRSQ